MGAADFQTGRDLLLAVQLDADELATGVSGDLSIQFQGYVRRAYWEILSKDRWPWALSPTPGTLVTVASVIVTVVGVSGNTVTLNDSVSPSMAGRKIFLDGNQAVYRIVAHVAGTRAMTLDAEYVEDERSGNATIYQDEYLLDQRVMRMWDPMHPRGQWNYQEVAKIDKPAFELRYGKSYTTGPSPLEAFTEVHWDFGADGEGTRRIRVAPWSEERYVLEYDYTEFHDLDFSGSANDVPRVPREYRQVIVDLAAYKAMLSKDDVRSDAEYLNSHRLYLEMRAAYIDDTRGQFVVRAKHSVGLGTG